jgi:hypothetical protein
MLAPCRIFASDGDPASSLVSHSNDMDEELHGATVMRPATGINVYIGIQKHPANSANDRLFARLNGHRDSAQLYAAQASVSSGSTPTLLCT